MDYIGYLCIVYIKVLVYLISYYSTGINRVIMCFGNARYRGCRGGTKLRRQIPVIVGHRPIAKHDRINRPINRNALITLGGQCNTSLNKATFATVNARSVCNKSDYLRI